MWLLLTALAAVITTAIWYAKAPDDKYKLGLLSLFFWGATLMWLVDHIIAYATEGGAFLEVNLDATLLGIAVIVSALFVWEIVLVVSDPRGVLKKALRGKS
jgi:hypothetical protein